MWKTYIYYRTLSYFQPKYIIDCPVIYSNTVNLTPNKMYFDFESYYRRNA